MTRQKQTKRRNALKINMTHFNLYAYTQIIFKSQQRQQCPKLCTSQKRTIKACIVSIHMQIKQNLTVLLVRTNYGNWSTKVHWIIFQLQRKFPADALIRTRIVSFATYFDKSFNYYLNKKPSPTSRGRNINTEVTWVNL